MKRLLIALVVILLFLLAVGWFVGSALWVASKPDTAPINSARPSPEQVSKSRQILFGDLHVHSSYSLDAGVYSTPLFRDTGQFTPVDACDFARYCSALDFWSINDHAESLTPELWRATKTAVQQCNAATDPEDPDMVTFLGWEWTQSGASPAQHYGHRNVILQATADDALPARPIGAEPSPWRAMGNTAAPLRGFALLAASRFGGLADYGPLAAQLQAIARTKDCAVGPVRDLPADCYEAVATPAELFSKLDEWGFDALVIPHGLAWGTTNPAAADFALQLDQHNPRYQRLLEVYSGHGNSEQYSEFAVTLPEQRDCPAPSHGYTPCCRQAGNIIRARCEQPDSEQCQDLVERAQHYYLAADTGLPFSAPRSVVANTTPDDWGQCDQLTTAFQPAYDYQPRNSAQYLLSLGDNTHRSNPNRMRLGMIASGDNHSARPGTGYKEFSRMQMTDSRDKPGESTAVNGELAGVPVKPTDLPLLSALDANSNANAFYFTGGLVAVHSEGRDRQAIWDALQRREVYGTSGPRIRLWFDLIDRRDVAHPMGSEVWSVGLPKFRVRAQGSFQQKPGCPADSINRLGPERLDSLCGGECYHPNDVRVPISRIEVVRVLPQFHPGEEAASLIQDPWRSFSCEPNQDICEVEFEDREFGSLGREVVYYARAIQQATPTVNGDPTACDYDSEGNCIQTHYCLGVPADEDCLSPAQHRAWSSPIFVQFAGE
jgi:hypothetical protein